jgi:hypothetical protein
MDKLYPQLSASIPGRIPARTDASMATPLNLPAFSTGGLPHRRATGSEHKQQSPSTIQNWIKNISRVTNIKKKSMNWPSPNFPPLDASGHQPPLFPGPIEKHPGSGAPALVFFFFFERY